MTDMTEETLRNLYGPETTEDALRRHIGTLQIKLQDAERRIALLEEALAQAKIPPKV